MIELIVINTLPLDTESTTLSKYLPMCVYQKKLFNLEDLALEQCVNSKGKILKYYTIAKYQGEYYKLLIPYENLKSQYLSTNSIIGFMKYAKGNSNTNV